MIHSNFWGWSDAIERTHAINETTDHPPGPNTAIAPYSPGLAVGEMVFVSGQGPLNPQTLQFENDGIEHQTQLTLSNVQRILEEAGCALADVVKVTAYLQNINDFERFNTAYQTFFEKPYPARTTVQAVLGAGISVEIDAIAIRGCGGESGV